MKKIFKKIVVAVLTLEAKLVLRKYKPKIVAVTGSVGKTTAKDSVYTVLSSAFFVRKSEKSFNSEIGVPLSILGCQNGKNNPVIWMKNILEGLAVVLLKNHYPKWLVLEVGADKPGDIEEIAKWLRPDVVVITRFADVPAHVEFFDSPKAVAEEKKKLAKYMKKDGFLILNYDDGEVLSIKQSSNKHTTTFGFSEDADVVASNESFLYDNGRLKGITFKVNFGGTSLPVNLHGVLGVQHIYPALAAIAVGSTQGLNLVQMSQALSTDHETQPGRMRIVDGIKGSIIIDDSYNASPLAVEYALKTLGILETNGRKIAVLGDMMELGDYTVAEHKKIGEMVAKTCDILVTVGVRSRDIANGALANKMNSSNIFQFEDSRKAGDYLKNFIEKDDIVLVKGSRWAMRMERVVKRIMAHPERAKDMLVN